VAGDGGAIQTEALQVSMSPLTDFIASPGLAGAFGALMDEYARAAADLCRVVGEVPPARFVETVDSGGEFTTVQAIWSAALAPAAPSRRMPRQHDVLEPRCIDPDLSARHYSAVGNDKLGAQLGSFAAQSIDGDTLSRCLFPVLDAGRSPGRRCRPRSSTQPRCQKGAAR
jgi:hypothetical protein